MIRLAAKKTIGILFIIIGLAALLTPFTPGSWLIFIGLELLGFRMVLWDKIKLRFLRKGGHIFDKQKDDFQNTKPKQT